MNIYLYSPLGGWFAGLYINYYIFNIIINNSSNCTNKYGTPKEYYIISFILYINI